MDTYSKQFLPALYNLRIVSWAHLTLLDLRLESIFVARDRRDVLYRGSRPLPPLTVDVRLRIRRNSKVRDICCPRTYFNIVLSHAAYNPQGFAVHMFVPCKLSSKCSISPYVSTVGRSMSRVWLRMLDDFWSHLRPFVKFVLAVPSYRQLRIDLRTSYRSLSPSLSLVPSPSIGEGYFIFLIPS